MGKRMPSYVCTAIAGAVLFAGAPGARADDEPLRHSSVIEQVLAADATEPEMTDAEQLERLRAELLRIAELRSNPTVASVEPVDQRQQLLAPRMRAVDSEPPPDPPSTHDHDPGVDGELATHWVGEIGLRIGGSRIDGVDGGTVTELLAAGGVHLDRITLLGEYGLSLVHHDATGTTGRDGTATSGGGLDTDQTTAGVMHRFGGVARYAFWRAKSNVEQKDHDAQGVGEVYVQAGGGAEIIQWDLGGRLVRPEASVGIGVLGAVRSSAHRRNGWFAGFKVQVARRIDDDGAAATCAAPCTTATPPVAWSDRSYLFETGFLFGN